jgi:hypothetical protein
MRLRAEHRYQESEMPIEVRELHIRVVVQDTSEAALAGGFAVEGDTWPDHKGWIDLTPVNMGGHKAGGGAAGDDAPMQELAFNSAQIEPRHTESGGGFLFRVDANAAGGGRDLLLGGAGADGIDAAASSNNRGHLVVGIDDVDLKAMFDGFDLM